VTGAGGFVGARVATDLEAAGHRVVRLARRPIEGHPETVLWDLRHDYSGSEPLPKVDAVVHCAASLATLDVDRTLHEANVGGTLRVAHAWPEVPLVFVSSSSVYPPSRVAEGGAPLREADVTGEGLHDTYSRSKLEAERALVEGVLGGTRNGAEDSAPGGSRETSAPPRVKGATGRSVTILRASIIYGPGDRTILPHIRKLRLGRWVLLPGGKKRWSMTPVGLLSEAACEAVERPAPRVRVLNVAEAPPERVRDLFQRLLEEDTGRRLRVIPIPVWVMRAYAIIVESVWRVLRLKREPMVTRSAMAYISEERILDLSALHAFLGQQQDT